ncbi:MAG TPA: aminodeoxychorismate/anthranilate synthase component II [Parvularcula sp.]|nr:aminodeoxychorismate/anthranilate synthase component II [Parvularcula sp.]HBS33235.1 aminodeoxychorismate/anthranilate synthase component II [Parvularcula sp.]HBS35347.1 aminodeoxychorismate/anthranilate synthase component II [Parvularcula sp.]
MILLIDNYDSFTWNLVHLIGGLGERVDVVRNDALTADEAIGSGAAAIVLSPGPGAPAQAGICVALARRAVETGTPLFGVCLGLQSIAEASGGRVVRAGRQMHGKTSDIRHDGDGLFKGLPSPFRAARYHSLVAEPSSLANSLKASAHSADDGEIMALEHQAAPVAGVQFHPESVASEHGRAIIRNFLDWSQSARTKA